MYPNYWGFVFCADEIIRSVIWSEMDEELREDEEYVPGAMPWGIIIRRTTFGGADGTPAMTHWWFLHAVGACQQAGSAVQFLQAIEGTTMLPFPDGYTSPSPTYVVRAAADTRNPRKKQKKGPWTPQHWQQPAQQGHQGGNWQKPHKGGKGKDGKGKGKGKDSKGKDGKGHGKPQK
jgi:hypothetical protein